MGNVFDDLQTGLQLTWNTGAKEKRKSLNKEQTTTPQALYK